MKVLILTNYAMGLYKFRKELIERLNEEHNVYIALPDGDFISELKEMGCNFIPFEFNRRGMNPLADIGQLFRYIRLIKELEPDVVLTYTIKPNVYGGMACQICHKPYIANITGLGTSIENGGLLGLLSTTLYKVGLRKASCVFFQNTDNRKLFESKGIVKGKTRQIPGSGVNLSMHSLEDYPEDSNYRFLFIGRLMRDKGIYELLEAIKIVNEKYPAVSLDIIGACDENCDSALRQACNSGYVRHHGQQKDVHCFIKNAHCVVLPSYHEGTANVMLEAQSTGRPVITTRVPGCMETFDEGHTGLGCEAKNVASLAEAMVKFIDLSHADKKQMGLNGRKKMECEFDRNIVIRAYLDEINKICTAGKDN